MVLWERAGVGLAPRFLLDTNIVLRWLLESRKLSRQQTRALSGAIGRNEILCLSGHSLVEIAILTSRGSLRLPYGLASLFENIEQHPTFQVLPITYEIALDVAKLESLRDPADRIIVATARVHKLKLLTADERIIHSGLVDVID